MQKISKMCDFYILPFPVHFSNFILKESISEPAPKQSKMHKWGNLAPKQGLNALDMAIIGQNA